MNNADLELIAVLKEQMAECCGKAPARCLGCWENEDLIAQIESQAA